MNKNYNEIKPYILVDLHIYFKTNFILGKVADKVVGKCGGNIANSMRNNCARLLERGRELVAVGGKHGSADVPQEFVDEALCVQLYRRLFMETGCQETFTKWCVPIK